MMANPKTEDDMGPESADDIAKRNIQSLRTWRHWTQADLAERIGKTQPWLSKRLTGRVPLNLRDLDLIASAFLVSAASLIEPRAPDQWERRSGVDRRRGLPREE